jgi:hypothetical protein
MHDRTPEHGKQRLLRLQKTGFSYVRQILKRRGFYDSWCPTIFVSENIHNPRYHEKGSRSGIQKTGSDPDPHHDDVHHPCSGPHFYSISVLITLQGITR